LTTVVGELFDRTSPQTSGFPVEGALRSSCIAGL
jgi:hypothetical protein